MKCWECDKDLDQCICPDLAEHFKAILRHLKGLRYVYMGAEYQSRILARIEELKKQTTK